MRFPVIKGIIDRRILVNYTVDPGILQKILPSPFRPKLYKDKAIAGVCLIRLKRVRPKGLPGYMGISSENGAHRIAVEWTENGEINEGVFIPRRDTSSVINHLAGGRIFPGRHFLAHFDIKEADGHYDIAYKSSDETSFAIKAQRTDSFHPGSIFETLNNASAFFEKGSTGYSPDGKKFEGLNLKIFQWKTEALQIISAHSSFFENEIIFPKGSVQLDNALLMTQIHHEWHSDGIKRIAMYKQ